MVTKEDRLRTLLYVALVPRASALARDKRFERLYAFFCCLALIGTTVFWAILGARVQSGNADQLVNSYLFANSATFHQALLPGAHSFLIKWPIFWLIKALGYSSNSFVALTVLVSLLTVMSVAFVIYRIERRPLVFGTLFLALSSALLLVPPVPAAGIVLPVNMAMLTTRNVEYVLYIGALWLLVRPNIRSIKFWAAVLLMAILVASDKLFLSLALGGALLALVSYALASGWNMVRLTARWLLCSLLSVAFVAIVIYRVLHHFTHIIGQNGVQPYGFLQGMHGFYLAVAYAGSGLLTNFGANPAFTTTVIKDMPHQAVLHLLSFSGPALVLNIAVLALGIYAGLKLMLHSFAHNRRKQVVLLDHSRLGVMLLWSTLAAFVSFIITSHYYAGDARYLTVSIFAIFVALAIFTCERSWTTRKLVITGTGIALATALAIPGVLTAYHSDQIALAPIAQRNDVIAQVLARRHVDTLVGDYWRVIPIKSAAEGGDFTVMPLADCTHARQVLTSQAWLPDLNKTSFAYLLTLDKGITGYPQCSLNQVIATYGRPNASVAIAGSVAHPQELLMFYNNGIRKSAPLTGSQKTPSTVLPITLAEVPNPICYVPTVLNIVAHQDDDLLFLNPDLIHAINAGDCIRTIYITSGDAGNGPFYWLRREQGSEAAYSEMLHSSTIWVQRIVTLPRGQIITIANPRGNTKVSLIFFHLPDGNVKGQGFPADHFESLTRLGAGKIPAMHSLYSGSAFTSAGLVSALVALMHTYQPAEVRTQANFISKVFPDHSDHMAVGRFVKQAYTQYESEQYGSSGPSIPIKYYIGYPVHGMPQNITGPDLQATQAAFMAYAQFDNGVCSVTRGSPGCNGLAPVYNIYIGREYQSPY